MQTVLINTKTKAESNLFVELAKKMGFETKVLTEEDKEDIGLLRAMMEARKTRLVSRKTVMNKTSL